MKNALCKPLIFSIFILEISLISCVRNREAVNNTNDFIESPIGYWSTEDSKLGQIGWKINGGDFKKCTIALGNKIDEEVGTLKISDNKVTYVYKGKNEEYTATYNPSENSLTEDRLLKLKYLRANDDKIHALNTKGCHL